MNEFWRSAIFYIQTDTPINIYNKNILRVHSQNYIDTFNKSILSRDKY
jgi:hypothetical protein